MTLSQNQMGIKWYLKCGQTKLWSESLKPPAADAPLHMFTVDLATQLIDNMIIPMGYYHGSKAKFDINEYSHVASPILVIEIWRFDWKANWHVQMCRKSS